MNSYVQKLQSKPEDARKQILLVSILTSMAIVVFVWVYGLSNHFNNETAVKTEKSLAPFTLFANSISNTYEDISASVGNTSSDKKSTDSSKQIDLIPVEPKSNQ